MDTVRPTRDSVLPFHKVVGKDAEALVERLMQLLGSTGSRKGFFPGPMCVSLRREHLEIVKKEPYWVCEKTDGYRFIMMATRYKDLKVIALFGRNLPEDVYIVGMTHVPRTAYMGTVVDGEMVQSHDGAWNFFVFDCMVTDGVNVCASPFDSRIEKFHSNWMSFYKHDPTQDAFILFPKKFFEVNNFSAFLLHMESASVQIPVDGIVFTPNASPIVFGRHTKMFKWKNPSDHTLDFAARLADGVLFAQDKGVPVQVARLVAPPDVPEATDLAICECRCVDVTQNLWAFEKVRTDKTYANDITTYRNTLRCITENLTLPELAGAL